HGHVACPVGSPSRHDRRRGTPTFRRDQARNRSVYAARRVERVEAPDRGFLCQPEEVIGKNPLTEDLMMRLVLGSRNKKKLKEMLALLGDLPLDLTDLTPYPDAPEVEETAETFVGNAALKATQLAPALGAWVIGEDSGLCVPALGGAPGVYSARYAG